MENKQAKIQTIVLIILTILVAVYLAKLFAMDKRMGETREYVVEQSELVENTVPEPKAEEPKIEEPTPEPVDPTITFLKSFLDRFEGAIQPEIRECFYNGGHQFAVTYDGGGIADGGWSFYNGGTFAQIESCGGYTAEPMPQDSLCRTALPTCTTVYKPSVSYFNEQGTKITTSGVDTYNLD